MAFRWTNYVTHHNFMREVTPGTKPAYPLSNVKRPSQVILIADGARNTKGGSAIDNGNPAFHRTYTRRADNNVPLQTLLDKNNPNQDGDGNLGWPRYRHGNNVNRLYVDARVKGSPKGSLTYAVVNDLK